MPQELVLPDVSPTLTGKSKALSWGIAGPGWIASEFCTSLKSLTGSRVAAVGSRDLARSRAFSQRFGTEDTSAYGSYRELFNDPAVDVVYIAVPHSAHHDLALQAIAAGKHVLVEKPFALNAQQAAAMAHAARTTGVFAMEAMWSRFIPSGQVLRALLERRTLGTIRTISANLGDHFPDTSTGRIHDPALGGGALLDLGIYPVALSSLICPDTRLLHASGRISRTGVDAYSTLVLENQDGSLSTLQTSIDFRSSNDAWISGEHGILEIGAPLYAPSRFILRHLDGTIAAERTFAETSPAQGLAWEAAHVADCLGRGQTESPVMPLDETVRIARTLDEAAAALHSVSR